MAQNTRTWRVDSAHRQPPQPKLFDLPNRYEIQRLLMLLDDEDLDLRQFSKELSPNPGLKRYLIACANFRLVSRDNRIRDAVHAFAYLGMRGMKEILFSLTTPESATA